MKNQIRKYYKTTNNLWLRPNSQFRYLKLELLDGTWKIVPKRIRTLDQLRKVLVHYAPKNAYFSTSCWLNPLTVEKRGARYVYADHCYLWQDLYVDMDNQDLNKARRDSLRVIEYMENKGYEVDRILFTNKKGFHVYFKSEHLNINSSNPYERKDLNRLRRALLFMKFRETPFVDYSLDFDVCIDPYRITRVEGSWNGNSGKPTYRITKEELSTGSFLEAEESNDSVTTAQYQGDRGAVVTLPPFYKYKALKNCVYGKKDCSYVSLVFKNKDLFQVLPRLNILSKYNIGKIYLIQYENYIHAVSPQFFNSRRIDKIMKAVGASNINTFEKFKTTLLRTTSIYDKDFKEVIGKPQLLMEIEFPSENLNHTYIVSDFIDYLKYGKESPNIRTIEVRVENRK